jgi:hypothetical protein
MNQEETATKNFFISYNNADRIWAEWIAWQLDETGYTTILQAWDFRPGTNFVLAMQRAAEEAQRIIAVLSPHYLAARFTQPEWAAAFARDPTGELGALVPVRVQACDLRGLLPQIIYIDLVGLDEVTAKQALLTSIQHGRAKPPLPPHFPGMAPHTASVQPSFPAARSESSHIHVEEGLHSGRANLHPLTEREGMRPRMNLSLSPPFYELDEYTFQR